MDKILFPFQADYLNSFIKESPPLIKEMEDYAMVHSVPILSRDSALFLEQLIIISRPKRVLEIGTAIGYSSIRVASLLRKKGVLHTIEKSAENVVTAKEFISRSGCEDKIKLYTGQAADIMKKSEKKYDFIFLDADKNDYKELLEFSVKLLKRKGIIFVDNLLWHGYAAADKVPQKYINSTENIREFNKIFMSHPKLNTILLPVGDGIGLGVKL